jgi:hypothetical protein
MTALGFDTEAKYYSLALMATKENIKNRSMISRKMLKAWLISIPEATLRENLVTIETGWGEKVHKLFKASGMKDIPGILNPEHENTEFKEGEYTIMVGNFEELKSNLFKFVRLNMV